jgi:hypothetical protein
MKAGFLTYPISRQPSHPVHSGQWQQIAGDLDQLRSGLTAAGTVRDSHPVPYYPLFLERKEERRHSGKYTPIKEGACIDEKKIFTAL